MDRLQGGILRLRLTSQEAGSSNVQLIASGVNVPLPAPFSANELLDQDTRVKVQLFSDASPTCWSAEYTSARKNLTGVFRAVEP
jgi:pyruvate dehydrogenase complex dehydrogenase (E1) component